MSGWRLVNGAYAPIELTTEPDGALKGYSEVMGLFLCWDEGWPRFYDPAAGMYLENWRQERAAREAKREALRAKREALEAERAAHEAERVALQARIRQLEEQVVGQRSEN